MLAHNLILKKIFENYITKYKVETITEIIKISYKEWLKKEVAF